MIVTCEISHYPLNEVYETDIIEFIEHLKQIDTLTIRTTAMSTLVKGELKIILSVLEDVLAKIYNNGNKSATVLKIIPGGLPIEEGYLQF